MSSHVSSVVGSTFTWTVAFAAALTAGAVGERADLPSQNLRADQGEVVASGAFGTFTKLLAGETRSLKDLLTGVARIEPGHEIHPPHQHAEEEFLYLAEGEGTWHLNGKESPAHTHDLLYTEPWVMHGLKNTSTKPLVFFVVKWNGKQLEVPGIPGSAGAETTGAKTTGAKATGSTNTGATPKVEVNPSAPGSAAPPTHSCIVHRDDLTPAPGLAAIGDLRRFLDGAATRSLNAVVAGVAILEPGQQIHPPHDHAEEEFLWIASGEGTWHLDGLDTPAHAGDLQYDAPWIRHGLQNSGKTPLTFFVLKWGGRQLPAPDRPSGGK